MWRSREPNVLTKELVDAQQIKVRTRRKDEEKIALTGQSRFDINEEDYLSVKNLIGTEERRAIEERLDLQKARKAHVLLSREAERHALAALSTLGNAPDPVTNGAPDPFEVMFQSRGKGADTKAHGKANAI
jgi:hypothetical protein